METFSRHSGSTVILRQDNVDTDQILPKQFMKRIESDGYEDYLFFNHRYMHDGTPNMDFELNRPKAKNASILVTGSNFGCGSARQHAVWALSDYGFKAVIATSFSTTFYANCLNYGLLPVIISPGDVGRILKAYDESNALTIEIDLENQILFHQILGKVSFDIDPYKKECFLGGKDDIEITLACKNQISLFEQKQRENLPWLWQG